VKDQFDKSARKALGCGFDGLGVCAEEGSRWGETRNRPLPAPQETPWTKTGLKPCRGTPFGLQGELKLVRKAEIPDQTSAQFFEHFESKGSHGPD
jgi:hypothetical protein